MRRTAIVLGLVLAGLAAGSAQAAPATFVHGLSPYPNPGGCHGAPQSGTLFVNSEVEPWVGDDDSFSGSDSLIGTWQQDRFSSGGSSGLLVAFSHNGGLSWVVPPLADQPAISNCQDPDNTGTNSDWERATDPWSDISPNGDMWFMSLSFNDTRNLRNAMLVSKSEDGGATWTEPVTLIDDANPHVFNDKNTLTADPNDSDLVYAVWDRLVFPNERSQGESSAFVAGAFKGPTYLSKTENGTDDDGGDWTTREILDLGRNDQTIGNQIAVLPRAAGETESTLDQRIRLDSQRQQARPQGREDLGHVVHRLWRYVVGSGRHRFPRRGGSVRHRPRRRALSRAARQQERPLHLPAAHR